MAQYTDQQMAAFSKIAYFELNDTFQANGPVYLKDVLTTHQKEELALVGLEESDYSSWKLVDVYDTNNKNGFACCTIETSPGQAAVAYRGSEGFDTNYGNVVNDWVNADLGLLNSVQTEQQAEVAKFLSSRKNMLNQYDLAMTGHSLGGNLAEYGTLISGRYGLDDNVQQCLSLDGPGFSNEFIITHAAEIAHMNGKMEHVQWSVVGNLLNGLPGVDRRVGDVQNRGDDKYNIVSRHDMKYLNFNGDGSIAEGSTDLLATIGGFGSKVLDHVPSFISNGIKQIAQGGAMIIGAVVNGKHVLKDIGDWIAARLGLDKKGSTTSGGSGGHSFGGGGGRHFGSSGGGGANVIKVSTEEMAATIAKYQSEKGRLMEAVSVCNNAAQLLARSWAGPSFLAMSVQMANTYKNLYQSINRVDDAIDELKKTIGIMENTEKNVKASAVSLDIGTSPFA